MREKIASLVDQIRRCAADLDYLANEEEEGFVAGLEKEEQKIAKRIERIAYVLDEIEKEHDLSLPELDDLDDLEEEEILSSLENELNGLEEEEAEMKEDDKEEEEDLYDVEDEDLCAEDEEITTSSRREEVLHERQAAQLK